MLQALRCVNIVIPYHELDYLSICKDVKADLFVIDSGFERTYIILSVSHSFLLCDIYYLKLINDILLYMSSFTTLFQFEHLN
jgi:hypothetical protein